MRSLLEATGDAFFVARVRPDVAIEFVTDTIVDLVGWTAQEHYDDPDLLFRMLRADFHAAVLEVFGGPPGTEFELELGWTRKDGGEAWSLHRGVVRQREDGSVVVEGSGRDITALHEARTHLEAAEAQFRLLAENASDVVYLLHPDGVVEWISPSVTRILGWPRETILGQPAVAARAPGRRRARPGDHGRRAEDGAGRHAARAAAPARRRQPTAGWRRPRASRRSGTRTGSW